VLFRGIIWTQCETLKAPSRRQCCPVAQEQVRGSRQKKMAQIQAPLLRAGWPQTITSRSHESAHPSVKWYCWSFPPQFRCGGLSVQVKCLPQCLVWWGKSSWADNSCPPYHWGRNKATDPRTWALIQDHFGWGLWVRFATFIKQWCVAFWFYIYICSEEI
jgi:hypothetical protein